MAQWEQSVFNVQRDTVVKFFQFSNLQCQKIPEEMPIRLENNFFPKLETSTNPFLKINQERSFNRAKNGALS